MEIISKHYGYVLIFNDKADLKQTCDLLSGFLEHVEENSDTPPPHLMAYFCTKPVTAEKVEKDLKELKSRWTSTPT